MPRPGATTNTGAIGAPIAATRAPKSPVMAATPPPAVAVVALTPASRPAGRAAVAALASSEQAVHRDRWCPRASRRGSSFRSTASSA